MARWEGEVHMIPLFRLLVQNIYHFMMYAVFMNPSPSRMIKSYGQIKTSRAFQTFSESDLLELLYRPLGQNPTRSKDQSYGIAQS